MHVLKLVGRCRKESAISPAVSLMTGLWPPGRHSRSGLANACADLYSLLDKCLSGGARPKPGSLYGYRQVESG